MKTIIISIALCFSIHASATDECRGVEQVQSEFIKLFDKDAKKLRALSAPNEESEKCNIVLGKDDPGSSDIGSVITKMPENYSSIIKNKMESARRDRLPYERARFFEMSMVKCYCQQRSKKLSKDHLPSAYGIIPGDSCKNLEDVQKVFRDGFLQDAKKLKTADKSLLEGFRIIGEREQSMCQWLSKKSRFSDDDTGNALGSIRHTYSAYIEKEMAKSASNGMSPYNARTLGLAMAKCYCLERSLEK